MAAATSRRKSAEERREEILAIAIEHFAARGFRGTSTAVIAREAGISQPCLFRLFRTKKELFLAADERACEKVLETFRRAPAAAPPGERLQAMGRAYTNELLPDRHAVLMSMQGFAAAGRSDPRPARSGPTMTSRLPGSRRSTTGEPVSRASSARRCVRRRSTG